MIASYKVRAGWYALPSRPPNRTYLNCLMSTASQDDGGKDAHHQEQILNARRQAAKLRQRQRQLESELQSIQQDLTKLNIDPLETTEGSNLPDQIKAYLAEAGVLGSEADFINDPDSPIAHEDEAEEFSKFLEQGGQMPMELLNGNNMYDPEPADQFLARWNASIKEYITRKGSTKGINHPPPQKEGTTSTSTDTNNVEYDPDIVPKTNWKGIGSTLSITPEEITKTIPGPDLPPNIQQYTEKVQRIMLVLRRAHKDFQCPSAAINALINYNLVPNDFITNNSTHNKQEEGEYFLKYEDPLVALKGADTIKKYMERLSDIGGRFELSKVFGRCIEYQPLPHWNVYVDVFLHLPYPEWLYSMLELGNYSYNSNGEDEEEEEEGGGGLGGRRERKRERKEERKRRMVSDTMMVEEISLGTRNEEEEQKDGGADGEASPDAAVLIAELYPRRPANSTSPSFSARLRSRFDNVIWVESIQEEEEEEEEEEDGRRGSVLAERMRALEMMRLKQQQKEEKEVEEQDESSSRFLISTLASTIHQPTWAAAAAAATTTTRDAGKTDISTATNRPPPFQPPSLEERQARDLVKQPLTPEEAEWIFRDLFGDDKFDKIMEQLPTPGGRRGQDSNPVPRGDEWKQGQVMTIALTFKYDINPDLDLERVVVDDIYMQWGAVWSAVADIREVGDIYVYMMGLLVDVDDSGSDSDDDEEE
jgi:hypothetical protein